MIEVIAENHLHLNCVYLSLTINYCLVSKNCRRLSSRELKRFFSFLTFIESLHCSLVIMKSAMPLNRSLTSYTLKYNLHLCAVLIFRPPLPPPARDFAYAILQKFGSTLIWHLPFWKSLCISFYSNSFSGPALISVKLKYFNPRKLHSKFNGSVTLLKHALKR